MKKYSVLASTSVISVFLLSGCSGQVQTEGMHLTQVQKGEQQATSPSLFQVNMAMEEEVSTKCVEAWRQALKGDEKGAVAKLEDLQKRYPAVQTIELMLGQVKDHFGKKEEALVHFRKAAAGNEYSMMHRYRLADALRETGRFDEAIPLYRKLIEKSGGDDIFREPFDFGLAYCLLCQDKNSAEGQKLLESCLKIRPDHKEALEFKKALAEGKQAKPAAKSKEGK
ncbi:MAG: tetratricopeptide repeat protein [Candidatus Obscuribacter phosphatis]|uniref:Tetratricopeptide repeat protein n=1 Tax=Candidatus Obscuribacter phosphatis TaxID=1906157 RepID=A0A8J7PEY8_9BACT|nr:tetratricopeptide repeat protein [Candidatus Obscuribacter phosphatis]